MSSTSYVWSEEEILGAGATAVVYKCFHKETKEVFAAKVMKSAMTGKSRDREYEILRKQLVHKNVVAPLDIEKCQKSGVDVIITEYCDGGSLHSYLSNTENKFGLCESDLLAVLRDLVSGMEYLTSKEVAHRDIKPLNILRTIRADGTAVYRLADFEGSRVLKEDQIHDSVVGTIEYMHPAMYFCLDGEGIDRPKEFKPGFDLWSFGVTMYQCITGKLPFRPYDGRDGRAAMQKILSTRSAKHISGIEKYRGGDIEWSANYPEHCRTPRDLLQLLLPIQRGVFNTLEDNMWKFKHFFHRISRVLAMKKIQAIDVFGAKLHSLYLPENPSFEGIQRAVSAACGTPVSDLLLLCNNVELDAYGCCAAFGGDSGLRNDASVGYGASAGDPIFVFRRAIKNSPVPKPTALLRVPLETDMQAVKAVAAAQRLHFSAKEACNTIDLINKGILALLSHQRQSLMRRWSTLERSPLMGANGKKKMQALRQLSSCTAAQLEDLLLHFKNSTISATAAEEVNQASTETVNQWRELCAKVEACVQRHDSLANSIRELSEDEQAVQKWKEASNEIVSLHRNVNCFQRLCQILEEKYRKEEENTAKKFAIDIKLSEDDIDEIRQRYNDCQNAVTQFEKFLAAWIKNVHEAYAERMEHAILDCDNLISSSENVMEDYERVTKKSHEHVNAILRGVIYIQGAAGAAAVRATGLNRDGTSYVAPLISFRSRTIAGTTSMSHQPYSSQSSAGASSICSPQFIQNLASRLERDTNAVIEESKRLLNEQ